MMDYRLGQLAPDRPIVAARLEGDGGDIVRLIEADGVYASLEGYRPVPELVLRAGLGTLNSTCRGWMGLRTPGDGTNYLVAGTATKLYLTSSGAIVDRTGASVPALAASDRWEFGAYDTGVLATSLGVAAIQRSTGAAFADLSADAPKAGHLMILDGFVIAGDIVGRGANAGLGTRRDGLQWCARGDETSWPAVGTDAALAVESDWTPLQGGSGPITLVRSTGRYGCVARERAVFRMDYTGGADIMAVELIEENRGCIAPGAGIAVGGMVYFPSEEGFVVFDGEKAEPIGWEKIDRTWWASLVDVDLALMSVAHDYNARTIWWLHPSSGRAWLYNYVLDRWTTVPMAASWIGSMLPIAESLDSGSLSAANLDVAPQDTLNLDSLSPSGADATIAVFNTAHQIQTLDGDPIDTAHLRTARFTVDEKGRRSLVRSIRPYAENVGGEISVAARGYLRSDAADKAVGYRDPGSSGLAPARSSGRFHEFDFLFSGDQDVVGFDVIASPQGVR